MTGSALHEVFNTDAKSRQARIEPLLTLAGWALPTEPDRLRLVLGEFCLDVAIDAVAHVTLQPMPWPLTSDCAVPVQVVFQTPPQLLSIGASGPFRQFLKLSPRPFALATRHNPTSAEGHEEYKRMEAAYLQAHGIQPSDA